MALQTRFSLKSFLTFKLSDNGHIFNTSLCNYYADIIWV